MPPQTTPVFLPSNISTLVDGFNRHKTEVAKSYAQAQPLAVTDRGQYLFATRCAPCHTIGNGVKIGPDLQGVTSVRDRSWLLRFIQKPDVMLTEKDPLATRSLSNTRKYGCRTLAWGRTIRNHW